MFKHFIFLFFFFCCFHGFSKKTHFKRANDTLKILSWNIQMLPNVYAPFTKLVRKKQKKRIPEIIKYLKKSTYDVVVLQEVFDIQMKNKLKKQLIKSFPYIQLPIKKRWGIKLSNGVMFLSKHPIELVDKVIFNVSKKSDRMAQKGCALVKLNYNGISFLIAGTHLDSKGQDVRDKQYQLIRDKIIIPYQKDNINFLLAGDLNTEQKSIAFDNMIQLFNLENSPLKEPNPYTFDGNNSWINYDSKGWIDFVLHRLTLNIKVTDQYIIRPTMKYKNKVMDLADHYGIVLELVVN